MEIVRTDEIVRLEQEFESVTEPAEQVARLETRVSGDLMSVGWVLLIIGGVILVGAVITGLGRTSARVAVSLEIGS